MAWGEGAEVMDKSIALDWRFCSERHSLSRYRPLAIMFQAGLFFVGSLFWFESVFRGDAFTEQVYGTLAYQIPAELWSLLMMGASVYCWTGLVKPVTLSRVLWGASLHTIAFFVIAVSAIFYGGEFAIGVFSSVFFVTPNLMLAWKAYDAK